MSRCHPAINALFFSLVLAFSMVFLHPVCLLFSLSAALCYAYRLKGAPAMRRAACLLLPLLLLSALLNPAFQHAGLTILTYLPSGNPLTLESIAYGFFSGGMIAAVLLWLSCCQRVMGSDKWIVLLGRFIPALSLLLSMSFRFIPQFRTQMHLISQAQTCIGQDASDGSVFARARHGIRLLSILITWSLENALDTADSMKSRGYGLPGRSAFSIFPWTSQDKHLLLLLSSLGLYLLIGGLQGALSWHYFPGMEGSAVSLYGFSVFAAYFVFCNIPLLLTIREDRIWHFTASNI